MKKVIRELEQVWLRARIGIGGAGAIDGQIIRRALPIIGILLLVLAIGSARAAEDKPEQDELAARLSAAIPNLVIHSVEPSAAAGIFQINSNYPRPIYLHESGQYFFVGDFFQISSSGLTNLAEEQMNAQRKAKLSALPQSYRLSWIPEGETRAAVTVFTDVDCGYCRQLHDQIEDYLARGIRIDYLPFPRSGPDAPTHGKMVDVWCAEKPMEAMTLAKTGQRVPPNRQCADAVKNAVSESYQVGNEVGVRGTPALVLDDGRMLPGYVAPAELANMLFDKR